MQVVVLSGRCKYLHVRSAATSMLQKPDKATTCIAGSDTTLNSYTKEPLIKSILRFVNATSMSHVSWMNSLSPESPIAALASTCNSPAHKHISIALENSESQSVSPRLNQRFPNLT